MPFIRMHELLYKMCDSVSKELEEITPDTFRSIRHSFRHRLEKCRNVNGHNFEHNY